jgi:catechol 2,3-dioxygenase
MTGVSEIHKKAPAHLRCQSVPIPSDTTLGPVRLAVADLDRQRAFYERAIGLSALESGGSSVRMGPAGGAPLVELAGEPDAIPRPPGTTGLFHVALLLPSRLELARSLRRVAAADWSLTGASDHLVSEALYTRDPEGNGIELYRDRPRDEWPRRNGEVEMATLPLDLEDVARELETAAGGTDGMPEDGRVGHVHLQVGDLAAAERFYHRLLGFDVTVRGYPGALFVSAGGYHHHVGLNTWAGEGAPAPPPGALGLRWFEVVLPGAGELERVAGRLREAGIDAEDRDGGLRVTDPSGNGVLITAGGR